MILASAVPGLALAGCFGVGDDISGCVWDENNVTITFHCTDGAGADVFPRDIASVDAFIFDEQDLLTAHRRFDAAALGEFRGWKLSLPAGEYSVLCWANVESNSYFSAIEPDLTAMGECRVEIDSAATETGDAVFYAPRKRHPHAEALTGAAATADYSLAVPAAGPASKEMHFTRAYRALNVYVTGFSDGGQRPVIEAANLWRGYDFMYNTLDGRVSFAQTAHMAEITGIQADLASFRHAFGEIMNDMLVTIRKSSDNSVVWTVDLREFIDENPAALKNDIDLLIEFGDLGVTVGIPGWVDNPLTPGR